VSLLKFDFQHRERTKLVVLTLFACFGILYLAPKILSIHGGNSEGYFDFQLFWQAGKIWASGGNPYDATVIPTGEGSTRAAVSTWFYPPYWYPLIVPFGLIRFQLALTIWKILNFFLLIVSTHLVARVLADVTRNKYLPIFVGGIAFVSFMYATAVTAWSGQSSILVYFGLSALVFGLLKARTSMVIVGLVFLALKPQIGLLAFVAVAALRRYRWAVFPAGVVCLLGTAAVAFTADLLPSIEGFLINLTRHSQHAANTPPHLTGVIHILDSLFSVPNASFVALVIFLAGIICTAVLFRNSPLNKTSQGADAEQSIATLVLFIAFSFFIIPFHYYDTVALVAIFMMIVAVPLEGRWVIALGLLLCYRPDFIWRASGVTKPEEIILSHLISPGLFVILIGAVWALWAARSRARLHSEITSNQSLKP
jgi:hypothetical protein